MLKIGGIQPGETVIVSGAAGATGSVAGQIARIKGCRVIGIAGGAEKCAWPNREAGFDAAIGYKHEDVDARLEELCPDGMHVYFDNVGGSISGYNAEEKPAGPANYYNLVQKRARMEGFVILDYLPRSAEAVADLTQWVSEGRIAWKTDVQHGFENAPRTLLRLYEGANFGKQLLEI